ncbi:hypothetical protein [Winogradskyella tangerina]|uniref:hypothetical protein n=1 Tax=Winogradskyella tangerina TaxID=2023240 RepID=UPI000DBEA05C|nr:hypothetical protein [Winogradskyella tangerina]
MKKALKIISTVAILMFGILWVFSKFEILTAYNSIDLRNILVVIYLFTSLKYFQMEVKTKNEEIQKLRSQLDNSKT